jgi:hypothetical protein
MVRGLKRLFAERDKKQTMIGLRGISTNWFKTQVCAPAMISGYWLWHKTMAKKFGPLLIHIRQSSLSPFAYTRSAHLILYQLQQPCSWSFLGFYLFNRYLSSPCPLGYFPHISVNTIFFNLSLSQSLNRAFLKN